MVAEKMGMISTDLVNIHQKLLVRCGLPTSFPYSVKADSFIQSLLKDKKCEWKLEDGPIKSHWQTSVLDSGGNGTCS